MADTLSCQWETLHSQQLRSIKKSIDSDHGIYRDLRNVVAKYPFERSLRFPGSSRILATETIRVRAADSFGVFRGITDDFDCGESSCPGAREAPPGVAPSHVGPPQAAS